MGRGKLLRFWGPAIMWAGIIFLFSALPTGSASEVQVYDFIIKKGAHVVEYAVLTVLLYRALVSSGVSPARAGRKAIVAAVLYGVTDELHQSFTPGREPHARDVVFDTIGALLAVYVLWRLLPKAPPRLRRWAKDFQIL